MELFGSPQGKSEADRESAVVKKAHDVSLISKKTKRQNIKRGKQCTKRCFLVREHLAFFESKQSSAE